MTGKEYLLNGDLKMLAIKLNLSQNHVSMVARGERKSKRVEDALVGLIKIRKQEVEDLVNDLDPKKIEGICHTNGAENLQLQKMN